MKKTILFLIVTVTVILWIAFPAKEQQKDEIEGEKGQQRETVTKKLNGNSGPDAGYPVGREKVENLFLRVKFVRVQYRYVDIVG